MKVSLKPATSLLPLLNLLLHLHLCCHWRILHSQKMIMWLLLGVTQLSLQVMWLIMWLPLQPKHLVVQPLLEVIMWLLLQVIWVLQLAILRLLQGRERWVCWTRIKWRDFNHSCTSTWCSLQCKCTRWRIVIAIHKNSTKGADASGEFS